MCVTVQPGKGNCDTIRVAGLGYDSTLALDSVFDGLRDVIDYFSNRRLPSAKDQITYFHIYIIPKISGEVKIYFR